MAAPVDPPAGHRIRSCKWCCTGSRRLARRLPPAAGARSTALDPLLLGCAHPHRPGEGFAVYWVVESQPQRLFLNRLVARFHHRSAQPGHQLGQAVSPAVIRLQGDALLIVGRGCQGEIVALARLERALQVQDRCFRLHLHGKRDLRLDVQAGAHALRIHRLVEGESHLRLAVVEPAAGGGVADDLRPTRHLELPGLGLAEGLPEGALQFRAE